MTCGGYCRWWSCWRGQAATLVVRGAVFLLALSHMFFVLFSDFFFLLASPLFSLLSLLFSSLSLLFSPLPHFSSSVFFFSFPPLCFCSFFGFVFLLLFLSSSFFFFFCSFRSSRHSTLLCPFFLLLPCFYRQKQSRDVARAAIMLPPLHRHSNTWKVFGQVGGPWLVPFLGFFKGEAGENRGKKKSSSSLASCVQGKKKTHYAVWNDTVLVPFFFFSWTVHETTPFWTKCVVSFKRKRRQKRVKVHIGPQFLISSIKSSIAILI